MDKQRQWHTIYAESKSRMLFINVYAIYTVHTHRPNQIIIAIKYVLYFVYKRNRNSNTNNNQPQRLSNDFIFMHACEKMCLKVIEIVRIECSNSIRFALALTTSNSEQRFCIWTRTIHMAVAAAINGERERCEGKWYGCAYTAERKNDWPITLFVTAHICDMKNFNSKQQPQQ